MITLIGLGVMALFAVLGYMRGALRMVASLTAFLVAGMLASPLSGVGAALLSVTGLVPRSLLGVVGMVAAGILIFIAIMIPIEITLRRREADLAALKQETDIWNRFGGALLGTIWGTLIMVLVLVGLQTAGQARRAMRVANAEVEFRAERRRQEVLRTQKIARVTHQKISGPIDIRIELEDVDDKKLKLPQPSDLEALAEQIEQSMFSPMVRKANPLDQKAEKTLRDLAVTVGDPALFERFQDHPQVRELMNEPRLQELAKDPEIAQAIREQRYRDLLDNPKLAQISEDKALATKLKALNIEKMLKDVKSVNWAPLKPP